MRRLSSLRDAGATLAHQVGQIAELPVWARLCAILAGAAQLVARDAWLPLFGLLAAAQLVDTALGRWVARHIRMDYTAEKAAAGKVAKLAALALLALIRGAEMWISGRGADSHGAVATALTCAFFVMELRSVERHREAAGARPVPGLSAAFAWLDGLGQRMMPVPVPAPAQAPVTAAVP